MNTLFLADAGTALPLLLLFTEAGQGVTSVISREVDSVEVVSVELVRTLVGSIGLVASVPIATWLAALTVRHRTSQPPSSLPTMPGWGGS